MYINNRKNCLSKLKIVLSGVYSFYRLKFFSGICLTRALLCAGLTLFTSLQFSPAYAVDAENPDVRHYKNLTIKAYYQERGLENSKSMDYTNLDSGKHTFSLRKTHEYTRGLSSEGQKTCLDYTYETGLLITVRPISIADVYIDAEVTIFNDTDQGLDYVATYDCGDVYTHRTIRQAKQVRTTLIMDSPKILFFDKNTIVGLLLH